jgi:hypothetical protein
MLVTARILSILNSNTGSVFASRSKIILRDTIAMAYITKNSGFQGRTQIVSFSFLDTYTYHTNGGLSAFIWFPGPPVSRENAKRGSLVSPRRVVLDFVSLLVALEVCRH